jgi:two-component system, cell cycle response regulator DivK
MVAQMRKDHRAGPTILLVEDDEVNRKLLRQLLEDYGHRIFEAADGLDALKIAKREIPLLILMDVDLPGLDGIGITRRVREDAALRETFILMITAFDTKEVRAAAFDAGCNEFLAKPLDINKLKTLLSSVLHKQ